MKRRNANLAGVTLGLPMLLALCPLGGCFEIDEGDKLPVASAGEDRSYPDDTLVTVTLDGTDSEDPDGEIVEYEWRYTGDPRGDDAPDPGADAGAPSPEEALGFKPRPPFCPNPQPEPWITIPERWCELAPGGKAKVTLDLPTGVHRFTLWVTDNDGNVGADSVVMHVGDTPYTPPAE